MSTPVPAGTALAPTAGALDRARTELVRWAPALCLSGIVLLSTLLRLLAASATPVPSIFPDELIYLGLSRSVADHGAFEVLGSPFSPWTYGPLYPLLIAPIVALAGDPESAYVLVKAFNCVAASLAAVPAYFLARRFVGRSQALVFASLCLAVPSLVYTTKVMTESVAYPVFLLAILVLQRALERPSRGRQLAALAVLGLAVLARVQMVVLVPAFGAAALASAWLAPEAATRVSSLRARLRAFRPTWLALGGGVALLLAAGAAAGLDGVLGLHAAVADRVDWSRAPLWWLYHLAGLDLAAGVVPLGAFALLLAAALVGRLPRDVRIFVLLTAAATLFVLLLVSVYATQPKEHPRVYERYTFYLVPLLLLCLLVWLQGLRLRRSATAASFLAVALLPLVLPLGSILHGEWGVSTSSASLVPWALLRLFTGSLTAVYVGVAATSLLLASTALLRRRSRTAPQAVMVSFLLVSLAVQVANVARATVVADLGLARDRPGWIDARVGADGRVGLIWSGNDTGGWRAAMPLWQSAFFNRSVAGLHTVSGAPLRHLPAERIPPPAAGARASASPAYVLHDPTVQVDGTAVARDGRTGMTLVRVDPPLRVHPSLHGRSLPSPR